MKKNYKKNLIAFLILISCFYANLVKAQLPIDCNQFYLHSPPTIYRYNPATSTYVTDAISCSASSGGLAVSNNLNTASPAVTFYTTISSQYYYYNGSSWTNTGHNCTSSSAVNICGAGPYIYNLDGLNSQVYRYSGTGSDVLVLTLANWNGPYDLIGDENGNFYVLFTNSGYQKLAKYSPTGVLLCTYSLVGMPNASGGAGYAIVNGKLYASTGSGDYLGTISGTTITFSSLGGLPGSEGDFASCAFPQLNSGITSAGNLTCSNLSSVLTATTSVTGPSYSWSGPGVVSGGSSSTATINQPGTYTVVITGSGGACPGAATSTISISQTGTPPTVSASTSGVVTCTNASINLSSTPAGMNYTWTAPGGSSITSGVNSQNAVGSGGGTYTVTIKDPVGGCTTTTVVTAASNTSAPSATASNSGGVLTCSTLNTTLSGTPTSGVTYSWSGPGIVSGGTTANPVVNQPGAYSLVVTNTSNGCSNSASPATVNVTQNITPPTGVSATANSGGVLTCAVTSLSLNGAPSSGVTYSWSGPGIISGGTTANPTVNQAGAYSLVVTNTSNGCSNSASPATVNVTQNIAPPTGVGAAASGSSVLTCSASTLGLTGTPSSGVTYNWSGPGIISGGTTANPTVNQPGTYSLVVTNTSNGCSNSASPATVAITQNVTPPSGISAAASGSSVLTCSVSTLGLTGTPSSGVTYSWSGPGIVSGGTTSNPTINQPGTYSLVVTDVVSGCSNASSPATVSITQNVTPPAGISATASGGSVLTCSITTLGLTGTPSSGVTYSWSGPGIVSGGTTANPTVNQPGTYSLVVTDVVTGCSNISSPATVVITQNGAAPIGTASAGSGGILTCSITSLGLTGTPSSGVSYSWSGPGIVSGGTTANPTVNQPGTYSLIVTDVITGCSNASSPATIVVSQNTTPPLGTAAANSGSVLTCSVTSLVLTGTPSSGVSYSWSGPGIVSGGTTSNPTVNQPGTYSLVVTDLSNGCSNAAASATVAVTQSITPPTVTAAAGSSGGVLTCSTSSLNLTGTPSSGVTYNWSGPGIVSGGTTSSPIINQPGSYSLTVTDNVTGCSNVIGSAGSVVTVSIDTIHPTAQINAAATGSITCTNSVVAINAGSSSSGTSISYSWTTTNGTITANANTNSPSVTTAGNYTLTVLNTANGCSDTDTIAIVKNVSLPTGVSAGGNANLPCALGGSISLNGNSSSANVSYAWSGPNNYVHAGQTATNVTTAGQYTLVVTDNASGCTVTNTVSVIDQSVHAAISANQTTGTNPFTVVFTNNSTGANSYAWNFGDNNTSISTNPTNVFQNTGTYTVVMVATNGICRDTARVIIISETPTTLIIPNIFSPNDDGVNDEFFIINTGLSSLNCEIFNRWGQLLNVITSPQQAWDGRTPNGDKAPEGTYMFILQAQGVDGKIYKKQGTLTLVR